MERMQDWNASHEAIRAAYSLGTAIVVLALGWVVGRKLTYELNVRQKRRDFQLTASQQFYAAYGEFFAVWKLWNRLEHSSAGFEDRRWELHKRAASAEAIVEGTLVKLSSELILTPQQINSLGRFRQAFQQLREVIRDNRQLPWSDSEHPEYKTFKALTVYVAALLGSEWRHRPSTQQATHQLREITSNKWMRKWVDDPSPEV
jgi:hypothetical protein